MCLNYTKFSCFEPTMSSEEEAFSEWIVVSFDGYNCVEAIPKKWYDPKCGKCWYPENAQKATVYKYITQQYEPDENWPVFPVKILGKAYDTYKKASEKALKAQQTDNLTTTGDDNNKEKRTRRPNKKYIHTSSDESADSDDVVYPKPIFKKKEVENLKNKQCIREVSHHILKRQNENQRQERVEKPSSHTLKTIQHSQTQEGGSYSVMQQNLNMHQGMLSQGSYNDELFQQMREFQKQVMRQLTLINGKLSQNSETLEFLVSHITSNSKKNSGITDIDDNPELETCLQLMPVRNVEGVEELENLLTNNNNLQASLAKELSRIGGDDPKKITKKIMYRSMTNEAGQYYSYEGSKGKIVFKNLLLSSVILRAVRMNPRTSNCCNDEIISSIKAWLAQAKNRLSNKKNKNGA